MASTEQARIPSRILTDSNSQNRTSVNNNNNNNNNSSQKRTIMASDSVKNGGHGGSHHSGAAAAAAPSSTSASVGGGGNSVTIGTRPTLIEVKAMRFLIMDAPRQSNLHVYIKEMRKHHVSHVVRVCEPTYLSGELSNAGICLHEMEYKDGTSPSKELIFAWLKLVEDTFYGPAADPMACIAVHCVAGLGRAPVMVALALIELANLDPVEAVSFLRQKRRGAINEKQLLYLEGYKKQYKRSAGTKPEGSCCVIS